MTRPEGSARAGGAYPPDPLSLQIPRPGTGVEPHAVVLKQQDDIGTAEQEVAEEIAFAERV
jgi:hypothetical protein